MPQTCMLIKTTIIEIFKNIDNHHDNISSNSNDDNNNDDDDDNSNL